MSSKPIGILLVALVAGCSAPRPALRPVGGFRPSHGEGSFTVDRNGRVVPWGEGFAGPQRLPFQPPPPEGEPPKHSPSNENHIVYKRPPKPPVADKPPEVVPPPVVPPSPPKVPETPVPTNATPAVLELPKPPSVDLVAQEEAIERQRQLLKLGFITQEQYEKSVKEIRKK